mmetsp:Transcript_36175/g.111940  ORF Transcript_36175/g.111940 Transcript_36175/m.111940 type:complete len:210 (-) Transcript_36175:430-1059(-)
MPEKNSTRNARSLSCTRRRNSSGDLISRRSSGSSTADAAAAAATTSQCQRIRSVALLHAFSAFFAVRGAPRSQGRRGASVPPAPSALSQRPRRASGSIGRFSRRRRSRAAPAARNTPRSNSLQGSDGAVGRSPPRRSDGVRRHRGFGTRTRQMRRVPRRHDVPRARARARTPRRGQNRHLGRRALRQQGRTPGESRQIRGLGVPHVAPH